MTEEKKAKVYNAIKVGSSIAWWSVLILLALLLLNVFSAKMSGKVPTVFGYSVMHIVSGSMEDEIPKDSYILIKKTAPDKIKRDDIICFYSTDPIIYGIPNTHRVVGEPEIRDGKYYFTTKGDASPAPDKVEAEGDRLIGVYVTRLDGLSAFAGALDGGALIIIIIVLQIAMLGMVVYSAVVAKSKEKEGDDSRKS